MVAWTACAMTGCAAVSGLDQIQESPCAPACDDGGGEAGGGDGVAVDAWTDSATGEARRSDSSTDRGQPRDSGADASRDAPGAMDVLGGEAPFDSGCGPLDTTENCSACNDTCAPTSSRVTMASCPGAPNGVGASCVYMCATGYLDCNAATNPPDLDGCECQVPLGATVSDCCSGGCPVQHTNGLNESFLQCSDDPDVIALAACAAFTGDATQCSDTWVCGTAPDGGPTDSLVCASDGASDDCACWDYAGVNAGHVHDPHNPPGSMQQNCVCPTSSDPSYN